MNKNTGKKLMVTMVAAAMALGTGTTSFAATGNTAFATVTETE